MKQSGLGGLSFDEGQFSVFGYVTKSRSISLHYQQSFSYLRHIEWSLFEYTLPSYHFIAIIYLCSYTVAGKDILSEIKSGDVIQSAKLVEGLDHLVLPES